MIRFSREKVLLLHQLLAEATGGGVGVRDANLLDSALEGIFATFGGQELYSPKEEKARGWAFRSSPTTPLWTATSASGCM